MFDVQAIAQHIHVLKLGGSLLLNRALRGNFERWYDQQPPGIYIAVVGGGEAVEAMRQLDQLWQLDSESMHWRCVTMLDATFEIIGELFPDSASIASWDEMQRWLSQLSKREDQAMAQLKTLAWIRVGAFYNREVEKECSSGLPQTWETTTDAIAGLLAIRLAATRLTLLKSCRLAGPMTCKEGVERGIVDSAFPLVSHRIGSVRLVSLGAEEEASPFAEVELD